MHSRNLVRLKRPLEGITKLWIKITALLQHKRLERISRITADKLLEGTPV
jgi:hypothetical protein